MGLVDYSSSSDSEPGPEAGAPNGKDAVADRRTRRNAADAQTGMPAPSASASALPPLPAAFHDLYASTVRTSTADNPALHQGRTRQIPHIAGNWPSHLYIEWFPTSREHAVLAALLQRLQSDVGDTVELHSFLASDLGAPLPLHISLSRPFVLRTEEKDGFLERLTAAIGAADVPPFDVAPYALNWHRSPDSARAFLVLRVKMTGPGNPELEKLLRACNGVVGGVGQPTLYGERTSAASAFHVSIAWSFCESLDILEGKTSLAFTRPEFVDAIPDLTITVGNIKAKIGNVVTDIPLNTYQSTSFKQERSGR